MGIFDFLKGNKKKPEQIKYQDNVPNAVEKQASGTEKHKNNPSEVSWSVWPEEVENAESMLNEEIASACSQGLRVLIYTYAPWSPGSVGFKKGREDEVISKLLKGKIHVVEVHFDTMSALNELGYGGYSVPQLYLLESDGSYAGVTETGGAWGDDNPANIATFLRSWLGANGAL
jgi:hypothetical protein